MDLFGEDIVPDPDEDGDEDFPAAPSPEENGGLPAPREASECLGHEPVEKLVLELNASGRMPHAMIFSGPAGIGKATMAFRVARFLLKHGGEETGGLFGPAEPPASLHVTADDPVSRRVASGGHPDLLTIGLPEGKRDLPVEDVRRIAPFLRMTASVEGGWRVVIVDDADTMSRSGQNAILKILEEPPPRTLLILIAGRPGALIPTIRSRCRVLPFRPLAPEILMDLLRRADPSASRAVLETAAQMAEGSVGRALACLQNGGPELLDKVAALLAAGPGADRVEIHKLADLAAGPGQDGFLPAFRDIVEWSFRRILVARARGDDMSLPPALKAPAAAFRGYSLERISAMCEGLHGHFEAAERGSLDRRVTVLGAFTVLGKS